MVEALLKKGLRCSRFGQPVRGSESNDLGEFESQIEPPLQWRIYFGVSLANSSHDFLCRD